MSTTAPIQSPFSASTRRMPGKRLVRFMAAGLLTLCVFAFSLWFYFQKPNGPILARAQVAGDPAAQVLVRRGFRQRGYVHLVLERNEDFVWSHPLFGIPDQPSLMANSEHIYLRVRNARGYSEVNAFDIQGEFKWRGARATHETPEATPNGLEAFANQSLFVLGSRLIAFMGPASGHVELVALRLTDGHEDLRAELPSGSHQRSVRTNPTTLVIEPGDGRRYFLNDTLEIFRASEDGREASRFIPQQPAVQLEQATAR